MESTITRLKAFADGNRMRIIMALHHAGELCPCQLTELLQVTGATISRHLATLQRSEIVKSRKEGKWVFFRLTGGQQHQPVLAWLTEQLSGTQQIDKDRKALEDILACDPEDICRKQRGTECCPPTKGKKEGQ